jgi:hypothetical protein
MWPGGGGRGVAFVMRKYLSTLALAKPKWNAQEILKIFELYIYGDKL